MSPDDNHTIVPALTRLGRLEAVSGTTSVVAVAT
jgi:hypothetical protein